MTDEEIDARNVQALRCCVPLWRTMHVALTREGFSEEQAFALTLAYVRASTPPLEKPPAPRVQ